MPGCSHLLNASQQRLTAHRIVSLEQLAPQLGPGESCLCFARWGHCSYTRQLAADDVVARARSSVSFEPIAAVTCIAAVVAVVAIVAVVVAGEGSLVIAASAASAASVASAIVGRLVAAATIGQASIGGS